MQQVNSFMCAAHAALQCWAVLQPNPPLHHICMPWLQEIEKDKASGVRVALKGTALTKLTGWVPGPKDTPYDGGVYEVDM